MSAGISYMYRISGGCECRAQCMDCRHIESREIKRGFGKSSPAFGGSVEYRCKRHPDTESGRHWKASYTACRFYERTGEQVAYKEEAGSGQLSFV